MNRLFWSKGNNMCQKKKILSMIVSVIFIFSSYPAQALDEFLGSALKISEARSKKLAVSAEQIKLSDTRVFNSGRQFFPAISFEDNYQKGNYIGEAQYQSEQLALKGSQPIYQGGKLGATYKHDSLMLTASKYNYTKTREELFAAVKLAYYELVASKMQYKALSSAFDDVEKLNSKVLSEYNAKAISELDLVESENFRDKVKDMLDNTKDDIALGEKKLCVLLNVERLEEIPLPMSESLPDEVQEISFSLSDCLDFARLNNIDVLSNQIQIKVAEQKQRIVKSRLIPNLSVEGTYGQGGEAFVTEPLDLATTWSLMGKLYWGLWGNSVEAYQNTDHTNPNLLIDPYQKVDNNTTDVRVGLLDDTNFFVQAKETDVNNHQARADYTDSLNRATIEVTKSYNDYRSSLRDLRTFRNEIILKKRKLTYLKKRNDLYEIPTVQLMEESWKYAETISSYAKALNKNYGAVTELERLTLVPMR